MTIRPGLPSFCPGEHPRRSGENDMTSLVTGGAGFIGSHVAEELTKTGETVVVLDDLSGGFVENIVGKGTVFVRGSINDAELIEKLFDQYRFDHVYHLAAYAAEGLSHFIRRFNYQNNLIGVRQPHQRVGESRGEGLRLHVVHRGLRPEPAPDDGRAGAAARGSLRDREVRRGAGPRGGAPHVRSAVRRLPAAQRVRRTAEHRRPVPKRHRHLHEPGPEGPTDDHLSATASRRARFSYIADVAPAIAQSAHRPACHNQVFNIGADTSYTVLELATTVANAMGVAPRVVHLDARKEVVHAFSSHDKVRAVLGDLTGNVPLDDGVAKMAAWARTVGARARARSSGASRWRRTCRRRGKTWSGDSSLFSTETGGERRARRKALDGGFGGFLARVCGFPAAGSVSAA